MPTDSEWRERSLAAEHEIRERDALEQRTRTSRRFEAEDETAALERHVHEVVKREVADEVARVFAERMRGPMRSAPSFPDAQYQQPPPSAPRPYHAMQMPIAQMYDGAGEEAPMTGRAMMATGYGPPPIMTPGPMRAPAVSYVDSSVQAYADRTKWERRVRMAATLGLPTIIIAVASALIAHCEREVSLPATRPSFSAPAER